ncbi:hypothetical protein EJ08DRAFT_699192 [Tothia fuscella]|uniref:Uncharacterized protein n=1 Tax=Tothia fuscella TaxID=1048955 RepID=A0A9P4TX71_9PEZI|nr:hypothetical protein EJ08DRAFT_699192 [Tothia fuscella]
MAIWPFNQKRKLEITIDDSGDNEPPPMKQRRLEPIAEYPKKTELPPPKQHKTQPCPFLTLPGELRNMVYKNVFANLPDYTRPSDFKDSMPVFWINKQIRAEAQDQFYKKIFTFSNLGHWCQFLLAPLYLGHPSRGKAQLQVSEAFWFDFDRLNVRLQIPQFFRVYVSALRLVLDRHTTYDSCQVAHRITTKEEIARENAFVEVDYFSRAVATEVTGVDSKGASYTFKVMEVIPPLDLEFWPAVHEYNDRTIQIEGQLKKLEWANWGRTGRWADVKFVGVASIHRFME